jgi:hypothetical protein
VNNKMYVEHKFNKFSVMINDISLHQEFTLIENDLTL